MSGQQGLLQLDVAGIVGRRTDEFRGRPGQAWVRHAFSWSDLSEMPSVVSCANTFSRANVKLDLATESSQATSIAVVSLDEQGVASYTFHFNDTANFGWQIDDLPELVSDDWLHIASLSCVVSPGAEVLLDWMREVRAQGLLRHQRATDSDHRSRRVLEQGPALAPGGWAASAASSRQVMRTSSSSPRQRQRRRRGRQRSRRAGGPLGRTVRARACRDHSRARWWSVARRARRKRHRAYRAFPQGGRHESAPATHQFMAGFLDARVKA